MEKKNFDVLIIGGGPAGLSAGLTLGRLSLSALICDDGRPRNAASKHAHNFPTRDGVDPTEWRKLALADIQKYPTVVLRSESVTSVKKGSSGFSTTLQSGVEIHFEKLVLADGVLDSLPLIPGFDELWGKSIFHCPFCHGYEARGQKLGLLSNSDLTFHSIPLISSLSSNLILFTNGKAVFGEKEKFLLHKNHIELIEEPITELEHSGVYLKSIVLAGGRKIAREALFFAPPHPYEPKSRIGQDLGCERDKFGFYKITERGETTIPGVFAAGDNSGMNHSVLGAAASGSTAGASIVFDVLGEAFQNSSGEWRPSDFAGF